MRSVASYDALDRFGRIRLSKHFFMRDFLYSEISNFYSVADSKVKCNTLDFSE